MDDKEREMWERLMEAPLPLVSGWMVGAALTPLVVLIIWLISG